MMKGVILPYPSQAYQPLSSGPFFPLFSLCPNTALSTSNPPPPNPRPQELKLFFSSNNELMEKDQSDRFIHTELWITDNLKWHH